MKKIFLLSVIVLSFGMSKGQDTTFNVVGNKTYMTIQQKVTDTTILSNVLHNEKIEKEKKMKRIHKRWFVVGGVYLVGILTLIVTDIVK